MHDVLFDSFSIKVDVVDKHANETFGVEAVIAFGTDDIDEYGEVVGRVDQVSFRTSVYKGGHGTVMTVSGGEFAGVYNLGKTLESNGYVSSYEITRRRDV